jgi:hypothetical protein
MAQDLKTILEKIPYTDDAQIIKQVTEQVTADQGSDGQ